MKGAKGRQVARKAAARKTAKAAKDSQGGMKGNRGPRKEDNDGRERVQRRREAKGRAGWRAAAGME